METTRVDLKRESFSCSICLDLLKDPVTLPCGHNYCKVCVEVCWQDKGIFNCPQCRQSFRERPRLQKNTSLAELVEELKKTGAAQELCCAGPEDVACDVCTWKKMKAIKSCLMCLVSYCDLHLQTHLEAPAFRRHKLVQPSKNLQEMICSEHEKEKKMFCRTDQQLICSLCVDQHKDHDIVSTTAERTEREKDVDQSRGRIQQRIQKRKNEVKLLQQEEKKIRVSVVEAMTTSQKTLGQMIQMLQGRKSDVEQQIKTEQETQATRVRGLQEQLKQEISELKKKDAELQQLSLTDSHRVFLHNWTSVSEDSEDMLSSMTLEQTQRCCEEAAKAISACVDHLQDLVRDTCTDISLILTGPSSEIEVPHILTGHYSGSKHCTQMAEVV